MIGVLGRVLATFVMFFFYGVFNHAVNPVQTLALGKLAGNQFANSDVSYITTMVGFDLIPRIGGFFSSLMALSVMIMLVLIWGSLFFKKGVNNA
jgi:hypothetical protein